MPRAISVDVELMIRLLEWARETARTDVELHQLVEHLDFLGGGRRVLTMADYVRLQRAEPELRLNPWGDSDEGGAERDRLGVVWDDLLERAHFAGLDEPVSLVHDDARALAGRTEARAMAACQFEDGEAPVVYVSDRLLHEPEEVQRGVLAHELGHIILMFEGDEDHSERAADDAALEFLNVRVRYDARGVQTTGAGVSPRPARYGR